MLLLTVYVLFVLGCWWVWFRSDPGRRAARAAFPATLSREGPAAPPRPPAARTARRRELRTPPLSEDDVIQFGLALEATDDVVRWAIADSSRGPAEPRARRDVAGPS